MRPGPALLVDAVTFVLSAAALGTLRGASAGPAAVTASVVGSGIVGFAAPLFNVQSVALRLAVSPPHLLGRVNAAVELVSQSAIPLGAPAGRALFALTVPRMAFLAVAAVSLLATAIPVLSPVARTWDLGGG